jgi:outer membrane protein assembly factor BamD
MNRPFVFVVGCALLAFFGCSLHKAPKSEDYYAQGELMYSQKNYHYAVENYQKLIDQYPFSPYAEDAELKVALSYYRMEEYSEAINALNDFQRMHPTNKNLDLASYYLAMAYFDQIKRADEDQTNTENALQQFQVVERRFPESNFAQLSHEQVEICREMLARNELFVSNYYYKRANFRAAESRLAELMQKYPDTPVGPEALSELAHTLEKEGKKYSAAQAYAALTQHFPDTPYAKEAKKKLAKLHQPIDNEEDPLRLVLAESGFGPGDVETNPQVGISQRESIKAQALGNAGTAYGTDGLPILDAPKGRAADKSQSTSGPVTLRTIRLASSDPPLSVIFDMSGPVKFDKHFENGSGYSTLIVHLDKTTPDSKLDNHIVFDRSIFKDCDVRAENGGTTVTVNTVPVARFAIIPLEEPNRLLVTFTPQSRDAGDTPGG